MGADNEMWVGDTARGTERTMAVPGCGYDMVLAFCCHAGDFIG